jgi:predicted DNA-binding transcriptional regulator YafY
VPNNTRQHARLARTFVEKHDQIDIAGRLSHIGEHGGGLASMLRTVIDQVCHRLPHDAPMRLALGRDVIELGLESLFRLPPLIFTEDEALALTLSLLVARESDLVTAAPAFEGVLAKVERVLPASARAHMVAVEQTVAFERGSASSAPSTLAVLVLSSAIQSGRRVVLRYRSSRAELTERAFDPYGIAYHRGFWYTIGYCHLREGQRLFRVDRIARIQMTSETFPQRLNFDALEAAVRDHGWH